jgi:hypothetical protein
MNEQDGPTIANILAYIDKFSKTVDKEKLARHKRALAHFAEFGVTGSTPTDMTELADSLKSIVDDFTQTISDHPEIAQVRG